MDRFDPRWSDDVRGGERHRDGDGPAIGREVPRGGNGSGGQEREPAGSRDPRDVFVDHVDLPRGEARERVYALRESYMHYAHLLKHDLVAASQQVRIPVAPRGEGNVVRMPRRGRLRPA